MRAYPAIIPAMILLALSGGCAPSAPSRAVWAPPPGEPPVLEADAPAERIDAWKADYLRAGEYVEATSDDSRVTLFLPGSLRRTGPVRMEATFRSELFRPRFADGQWLRSIRKRMEIDCAALRYRELTVQGFAGSNMTGPVPPITPPVDWSGPFTPDSSAGSGLKQVCERIFAP
ncbi:MAG: surface-adhesin E family protein [Sphingobium sp.]